MRTPRRIRGVTLIEAVVSLAVFAIGMVGVLQLQLIAARSNAMARKLGQASALAQDLVETAQLWAYDDPRLTSLQTITSLTDPTVNKHRADVRGAEVTTPDDKPHYAEFTTGNATHDEALADANGVYQGLSSDIDGDAKHEFERYWNVFELDQDNNGVEDGKLVVAIVRWFEDGVGYRRLFRSTFLVNERTFNQ